MAVGTVKQPTSAGFTLFDTESVRIGSAPKRRVKVLLDARKITHGGIGTYVRNLAYGLLSIDEVELALLGSPQVLSQFAWPDKVLIVPNNTPCYSLSEYFVLGHTVNNIDCDLVHFPHYTLPFGLKIPAVVTVHDLIHIQSPKAWYYPPVGRFLIGSALKRADKVITVSQASQYDIGASFPEFNILSKVTVIPNAIDPAFSAHYVDSAGQADLFKQSLNIPGDFFLSVVSDVTPHKGVIELLEAYAIFRRRLPLNREMNLMLCGRGLRNSILINQVVHELGLERNVFNAGEVTREELVTLYRTAKALIVPSRIEGFCLPVIEAQAAGTPVITTPVPAVREIVTAQDIVCKGFLPTEMALGMEQFIGRPKVSIGSIAREKHLGRFDRRSVAEQTFHVYQSALMAD